MMMMMMFNDDDDVYFKKNYNEDVTKCNPTQTLQLVVLQNKYTDRPNKYRNQREDKYITK